MLVKVNHFLVCTRPSSGRELVFLLLNVTKNLNVRRVTEETAEEEG